MTGFVRKSALIGLLSIFSLVSLFGISTGAYAKVDKPKITVSEKAPTFIVLNVKQSSLEKDKVTIKVRVEKVATGEKFDRTFKVKLSSEGKKKITIKDLKSATEYKFKAKIKKRSGGSYSEFSSFKKASTRP